MDLCSNQQSLLRCEPHFLYEVRNGYKTFVDGEIRILGILHKPVIGIRIGAKDKFQVVPFKAEADRSIK